MGDNTLQALTSDLAYLQAWSLAATVASLPWPAPEALLLKFVAHHLWDPDKRASDPQHGMPEVVERSLRDQRFMEIHWSACTRYSPPPVGDLVYINQVAWPVWPLLLPCLQICHSPRHARRRKSAKAGTGDILAQLLADL